MDIETTFLSNPKEYLAITSPEQLFDEYPNQFIKKSINENTELIIELQGNNKERNEKERVFCSKSNISIIESDNTYSIWDLDITDEKILNSINSKVVGMSIRNEKDKKKETEEMILPDYNKLVKVTYLPNTLESSNYLINMLDKRKELLQK